MNRAQAVGRCRGYFEQELCVFVCVRARVGVCVCVCVRVCMSEGGMLPMPKTLSTPTSLPLFAHPFVFLSKEAVKPHCLWALRRNKKHTSVLFCFPAMVFGLREGGRDRERERERERDVIYCCSISTVRML